MYLHIHVKFIRLRQWKRNFESWNFPFSAFSKQYFEWAVSKVLSFLHEKTRNKQWSCNLKPKSNNLLQTLQNISFDLKEILLKKSRKKRKEEEKKKSFHFFSPHFGGWNALEIAVIYAALITEFQTGGCINHIDLLLSTGDVTPL